MDDYGKNTNECLYLRKWRGNDKAEGKLPYEIVRVTLITRNGKPDKMIEEILTDPEAIAYHNEQAEIAEKGVVA